MPKQTSNFGWHKFMQGYPWFKGEGKYPLPAYSEFMPAPRVGINLFGQVDDRIFIENDPYGWGVPEVQEEYEIQPGLKSIAEQTMHQLRDLGLGRHALRLGGPEGRNLQNNPYWPDELQAHAGNLKHERYVTLLPLALSRTQDDMGRVRWTLFGSSEQGPERGFWMSFYSAPDKERPAREGIAFFCHLLSAAYGERVHNASALQRAGLRILPTSNNSHWLTGPLPSWAERFVMRETDRIEDVRYLLTFRPFAELSAEIRAKYLGGDLALLPFPGSLSFWGAPLYTKVEQQLPLAAQFAHLHIISPNSGYTGMRVAQAGWMHEPGLSGHAAEIQEELLLNTYHRTSRWDRVHRHADNAAASKHVDSVSTTLFSGQLVDLDLYNKPMARNAQVWTKDADLILDGPNATREEIQRAAKTVFEGGIFRYRFIFPAMCVGRYEVYWQRPLVTYWSDKKDQAEMLEDAPLGYLTAYRTDKMNLRHPIEMFPVLHQRDFVLDALREVNEAHDVYRHQTGLNVVNLVDLYDRWGDGRLPASFAYASLRIARHESLEGWLASLTEHTFHRASGRRIRQGLEKLVAAPRANARLPEPLTYDMTATRAFEEAYWSDLLTLSQGEHVNKSNADVVQDDATLDAVEHPERDLEGLSEYLIDRHRAAIRDAGMEGKAIVGALPFEWRTDFDFSQFGGWRRNQEGKTHERNILVIIPGKNRREAVILGDHYDTAYMEDIYEKERGGSGARVSASGADDNHSATATLLLGAPVFLKLAKQGKLERDVWLLHLTGEEFPSDSLGARVFCEALVEKTLKLHTSEDKWIDLSRVQVVGALIMDMIAHNRDNAQDIFQISPGRSKGSIRLAFQAHLAALAWNAGTADWNESPERKGRGRGKRSADGKTIPEIARHPILDGEVRTTDDPMSSLYNTDVVIFDAIGAPTILIMENYDIDRTGYHDTHDTMENIDLDYGAALAAISIETIARVATGGE